MKSENGTPVLQDLPNDDNSYGTGYSVTLDHEKTTDTIPEGKKPQLLFECCLIDHLGKQFACIHPHCLTEPNCFVNGQLQDNLAFHQLQFHPEDRMLWSVKIFPDILMFIDAQPHVELPNYRFIFNHRYIRTDGSISQFIHEGSLIFADNKWLPVLNLKVFFEIADLKTDESIVLTIFHYSALLGYQKVFTKEYSNTTDTPLSRRELEIINLCHQGLSSKLIAEKLNLSIHTVKNHKRKSMEKTLTHTITELIHLCLLNHWLSNAI
jgi:DNA-binding CsgD family transcriptional regulator